jgi:hypothetical protein
VVAWSGVGNEGIGIYARRLDATGMPYADDFLVANRTTTSVVVSVGCAADDNGDFVITWESPSEDGSRDDVFARRYDVSGSAQGGAFRANTSTGGDQRAPAVAVDADGDFLVAWQSSHLDQLIGYEIYAQRYTTFDSAAGGTIGDRVWNDGNADGLQDDGEPGIAGALVELYTDAGSPVASTTTGAAGNYVFPTRNGERARLRFLAPNGFIPVRVRQGIDPQRDSDADRVTGQTILLAPASAGSAVSDVDAGFSVPAAVSGAVFFDRNDNGVRDGGEEGVGGFLVFQDLDADGARDADEPARVTDPGGNYAMTDALGGTYRIVAQDQHLWIEPSLPPLNVSPGGAASASNLPVRTSARDTAATPAGTEFRANTYTTNHQSEPAVAVDASGDFIIVWEGYAQDGSGSGIYAQRYDDSGAPRGAEFRVNSHTSGSQRYPAVALDAAGNVVVAWYGPGPGDGSGIFARRFDADGAALGTEFRVNTNTADEQFFPSVAMTGSGAVVVTWVSRTGDGSGEGVYAQRYDGSGAPQGSEFRINTQTIGAQRFPDAAIDAAGNFVITWESQIGDGSDYGIFARRFDADGIPRGDEFLVNSYTTGEQLRPTIAADAQGNFVIAWESRDQDGYTMGVYAQRYGVDGAPRGAEFRVNAYTLFSQASASAAMTSAGEFVIAWVDGSRDGGNGPGVYAQRFNAAGLRQGDEFRVNTYTTNSQYAADAAIDDEGDFVVTWTSRGQDASGTYGAYAQRYAAAVRPSVAAGRFHWQTAPQRVELVFDQDVSASISPDDLIVRNVTTAQTVPSNLIVVSWDAAAMTARFAFPSLPDGGALPNGDYVATLVAGGVSNAAGTSIAVDYAVPFFFLRGDANRDGRVNLTDFNILAANFGASPRDFSQGDFNYDGLVNLLDFNLLAARFGDALGATTAATRGGSVPREDAVEPDEDPIDVLPA